jgi:hypothetical protein
MPDSRSYVTYEGASGPEWPTRNTIAAAFDGWARALEAAGFGSRGSARARERAHKTRFFTTLRWTQDLAFDMQRGDSEATESALKRLGGHLRRPA